MSTKTMADAESIIIEKCRELLKPSPVVISKFPKWLTQRLRDTRKLGRWRWVEQPHGTNTGAMLEHALFCLNCGYASSWLDHYGSTNYNCAECFVSEPYNLCCDDLRSIEKLCEMLEIEYSIRANSYWNPGHTIRILFFPPSEELKCCLTNSSKPV